MLTVYKAMKVDTGYPQERGLSLFGIHTTYQKNVCAENAFHPFFAFSTIENAQSYQRYFRYQINPIGIWACETPKILETPPFILDAPYIKRLGDVFWKAYHQQSMNDFYKQYGLLYLADPYSHSILCARLKPLERIS